MKTLTKKDIELIVKESNEESLKEYFPSDADREVRNRKEVLLRYQSFIEGVSNNLRQFVDKAKSDYDNEIINDADVDYLISDQCERAMEAVGFAKSSLMALKTVGIKPGEMGPLYPVNRYEE